MFTIFTQETLFINLVFDFLNEFKIYDEEKNEEPTDKKEKCYYCRVLWYTSDLDDGVCPKCEDLLSEKQ